MLLQNAGDETDKDWHDARARARACTLVAGSYALGVYSAWCNQHLGQLAEKAGPSFLLNVFEEEVATLKSLRGQGPLRLLTEPLIPRPA